MKNKKKLGLLLLSLMIYGISFGQEEAAAKSNTSFDLGVDFASRYVWRGLEFSDSPAVQPYAEMTSGNFTLGIWASYETGGQVVGQEFDFYASYSFGAVSLGFIDYSFSKPSSSLRPILLALFSQDFLANCCKSATLSLSSIISKPSKVSITSS